jgi:AraC-like DNA-binding protein/DNA gyrase inhibitor GyrI
MRAKEAFMSYINNANFAKVVRVIYDNLEKPLSLEHIAKEVGLSVSSLKRLFLDVAGQTPGAFIRHLRMELAFVSLKSHRNSVLEVALNSGFQDQAAFARCFKETFGYSPTHARKKLNILSELDCIQLDEPDILELKDLPMLSVTEKGLYAEAAVHAWQKLQQKLTDNELNEDFTGMLIGIGHDNPHEGEIAADEVRFTAGITLIDRDLNLTNTTIPEGRYARFRYIGKPMNLGLAYHYIYGKWQESAIKINQAVPAFISFDNFPDGIKEQKLFIHVPLEQN